MKIKQYLKNLLNALLGKTVPVKKSLQVIRTSVTREDVRNLRMLYPKAVYKPGVSVEVFAYSAGQHSVIDYLERRTADVRP